MSDVLREQKRYYAERAADDARRLKLIRITTGGKSVDVPAKQFNSLAQPLLDTAQIMTSVVDDRPELYVVIQIGKWGDDHKRERRIVFFTYKNGKVVEPRLYQLIRQPHPIGDPRLPQPDVDARGLAQGRRQGLVEVPRAHAQADEVVSRRLDLGGEHPG